MKRYLQPPSSSNKSRNIGIYITNYILTRLTNRHYRHEPDTGQHCSSYRVQFRCSVHTNSVVCAYREEGTRCVSRRIHRNPVFIIHKINEVIIKTSLRFINSISSFFILVIVLINCLVINQLNNSTTFPEFRLFILQYTQYTKVGAFKIFLD